MDFQWIPLTEPDQSAIERMIKAFPKPTYPMQVPELDTLCYHTEAFEEPVQTLEVRLLADLIDDATFYSREYGIDANDYVNHLKNWFFYVLPFAIQRGHEFYHEPLLNFIFTAFINFYQREPAEEYEGFRQDILATLATGLMNPEFWDENGDFQIEYFEYSRPAYYYQASPTFSAAMFFCLKILTPAEMTSWVKSLLAISGARWRKNFILWLINADKFFETGFSSIKPVRDYLSEFGLGWFADVTLTMYADEFVPKSNYDFFCTQIFQQLTPEVFLEWVAEISDNPEINNDNQITGLPEIFFDRFYSS